MDFARDLFARNSISFKLAAAALAFVGVLAVLQALNESDSLPEIGVGSDVERREGLLPTATTQERIEALRVQAAEAPSDPEGFTALGAAYLTRIGETEDPAFYADAERSFQSALDLAPKDFGAVAGMAELELSRHHFRKGLALSLQAREINPSVARIDGLITDAQIELGRYAAAERTLERYGTRQPELASYARVSYYRELNGDSAGAIGAMQLAASAAGEGSPNATFAETLLGRLRFELGDYAAAEGIWRGVLAAAPAAPDAQLGLAAIEAGRGDLDASIDRHRAVFEEIPAPDHAILLGEAEEAAGNTQAAEAAYAEGAAAFDRLEAQDANVSTELAVFEADHGSVDRAVAAGKRAWRLTPSVRAADAYSWALSAAGQDAAAMRFSREAMRLGSFDPAFLFHAGIVSRRAGEEERARALLGRLLEESPRFSPLHAPRARAAFEAL